MKQTNKIFPSFKDRVKKLTAEKEALESHIKNEKDEKELYKVKYFAHLTLYPC